MDDFSREFNRITEKEPRPQPTPEESESSLNAIMMSLTLAALCDRMNSLSKRLVTRSRDGAGLPMYRAEDVPDLRHVLKSAEEFVSSTRKVLARHPTE